MLILTRRVGETIIIGNGEISITVLGVKGNQVRVGINAPKSVAVHREEIYERIKLEIQEAARDKPRHTAELANEGVAPGTHPQELATVGT